MSDELDGLTGGEFRQKLEDALEENRKLKGLVSTYAAEKTIRDEGLDLVKVEDLSDVPAEDIITKAKELQEQRFAERRSTVIDVLRKTGVPETDVEAQAEAMLKGELQVGAQDQPADADAWSRVLGASQGGTPVPAVNQSELHGSDAIAYGLAQAEARRAATK